jgi:hypothetical protein
MNQIKAKELLCDIIEQVPNFIESVNYNRYEKYMIFHVYARKKTLEIDIYVKVTEGEAYYLFFYSVNSGDGFPLCFEKVFKKLKNEDKIMNNDNLVLETCISKWDEFVFAC